MRGLAQLEPATGKSAGPQSASGRQVPPPPAAVLRARSKVARRLASNWGPRQRGLLMGIVITVVGLSMVGYWSYFRPLPIDAQQMRPIQSWGLWRDLNHGIDQRSAWEETYLELLANYRRWMIVSVTVTGVGVLVMAGALLAPKVRRKRPARRPPPSEVGRRASSPVGT